MLPTINSCVIVKEFGDYKVCKVVVQGGKEVLEVRHKNEEIVYRLPGPRPPAKGLQPGATPAAHGEWLQENIQFRSSDIVIATFPRCGTTWTEQIVLLLLNGGDVNRLNPLQRNIYTRKTGRGKIWAETMVIPDEWVGAGKCPPGSPIRNADLLLPLQEFNAIPAPRLLKTHATGGGPLLLGTCQQKLAPAKYIVVTRNMFDACVSGYYQGANTHEKGWPFEAWALHWLYNEKRPMSGTDYLKWYASWKALLDQKEHGEFLWLYYEDLLQSPQEGIAKIARFIGVDLDAQPGLLDKVMEGSSFQSMKAKAKEAAVNLPPKAAATRVAHYRKGKIGDWRTHFTPELEQLFRQEYQKKLGSFGLKYNLGNDSWLEQVSVKGEKTAAAGKRERRLEEREGCQKRAKDVAVQ